MASWQPDRQEGEGGSYEIFRFVNKIDLVPRLPLAIFSHAGHTLQITSGNEIKVRGQRDRSPPMSLLSLNELRSSSVVTGVLRSPGRRGPGIRRRAVRMGG